MPVDRGDDRRRGVPPVAEVVAAVVPGSGGGVAGVGKEFFDVAAGAVPVGVEDGEPPGQGAPRTERRVGVLGQVEPVHDGRREGGDVAGLEAADPVAGESVRGEHEDKGVAAGGDPVGVPLVPQRGQRVGCAITDFSRRERDPVVRAQIKSDLLEGYGPHPDLEK